MVRLTPIIFFFNFNFFKVKSFITWIEKVRHKVLSWTQKSLTTKYSVNVSTEGVSKEDCNLLLLSYE